MKALADELEKEEEGDRTKQTEDRIQKLERELAESRKGATKAERDDAIEELSDEEWDLVTAHRAGKTKPKDPDPEPEEKPRRTRPGRKSGSLYEYVVDDDGRVQKVDIPTVYAGEDEPDEVEVPDDDAEAAA
jgi:hypothetical protein